MPILTSIRSAWPLDPTRSGPSTWATLSNLRGLELAPVTMDPDPHIEGDQDGRSLRPVAAPVSDSPRPPMSIGGCDAARRNVAATP